MKRSDDVDLDLVIECCWGLQGFRLRQTLPVPEGQLRGLAVAARGVFLSQPTFLEVHAPVHICGDIHGQYHDLLRIFDFGGLPPNNNYLFLGDYVDKGKHGIEVFALLLAYKVKYPDNFFLLRGSHECASINRIYGFYDECKRRCSIRLWKTFCDVFDCMPLVALVSERVLCMHGGLSPELTSFDKIRNLARPIEVPESGLVTDILWSDPDRDTIGWEDSDRGVSYMFGPDVVEQFLARYDLDLICRSHQVVQDGYEFFGDRTLITVFSAPNYNGEFDNAGAFLSMDDELMCSFKVLKALKPGKEEGADEDQKKEDRDNT